MKSRNWGTFTAVAEGGPSVAGVNKSLRRKSAEYCGGRKKCGRGSAATSAAVISRCGSSLDGAASAGGAGDCCGTGDTLAAACPASIPAGVTINARTKLRRFIDSTFSQDHNPI